ncbi:putative palmitoyltransferase ZDHHC13 [Artemia franciscana]
MKSQSETDQEPAQAMSMKNQLPERPDLIESVHKKGYSAEVVPKKGCCAECGVLERCKQLVEAGYNVNKRDLENLTLLHWASLNNRKEIVNYYISQNAVVDAVGGVVSSTPLHWAIK